MFIALFKLSRPVNVLIAFLTVVIAAELAGGLTPLTNALLAAIVAALITTGANVINDYYDIAIDRVNKPYRPLAAGVISQNMALNYFILVYFMAWAIAWTLGLPLFLIAVTISILLFFYSYKLKRTVLAGNLTVSFATAMAFIFGGGAVFHYKQALFPALFAFFFHLGREILKDVQDQEGDGQDGAITLPLKYGIKKSLLLMTIVFIIVVILTLIPYILEVYSLWYFLTVCIGVYPVLVFVAFQSWKNNSPEYLGYLSNLLKVDMLIGLLAIYLR
ncbi:MAG: hypothetical protein E4H13_00075 [Calditrichales bacterium]|nr:MAG: hypothetical protein E4H13_00075 [Calditrichales bacterium]